MAYKLGKLAPKFHPKTLDLSKFLKSDAPLPDPGKIYLEYKIPPDQIGMFGNDQFGDCTCAMVAHWLMVITAHTGTLVLPTEDEVIGMYEAVCPGFDPDTDANDNGAAITDVLDYWNQVGLSGHKIDGWAQIATGDVLAQRQALYAFLGIGTGVQLPAIAQTQFSAGEAWDVVPNDGGIEGGHAILETGAGSEGVNFQSWGKGDVKATAAWNALYPDERYIALTHDLIEFASQRSPFGFDYPALQNALQALKS